MEIEGMKPGRELDALVAEKVMGLKRGHLGDGSAQSPFLETWNGIILPAYSTDIAAAWEVVEKLQKYNPFWQDNGFMEFELSPTTGPNASDHGWHCNFGDDTTREYAETAPHAICLAALKAVGI